MRRVAEPTPLVPESFPAIRAIYELLHAEKGVTYADLGRALGCSGSRVKQIIKGYSAYKNANGIWTVGIVPPKEESVAVSSQGPGPGEEGPASPGCLPGATG